MRVKMIIEVPEGKYCWRQKTGKVCHYLTFVGNDADCDLGLWPGKENEKGIRKSPDCIKLEKLSAKVVKSVADTGGVMSNINDLRSENSPEARAIIKYYDYAMSQEKAARKNNLDDTLDYWSAVTFTMQKVANLIIKEREKS